MDNYLNKKVKVLNGNEEIITNVHKERGKIISFRMRVEEGLFQLTDYYIDEIVEIL